VSSTAEHSDSFDVIVVGGGINGAGIARDAALPVMRLVAA